MKGIVVEINNNDAVILTDNGLFTKVRNRNYAVGQAIKIQENKKIYSKWVVRAASMAAAFAVCIIGAYAWFTPTDYVSLDVNPSVEYSLNTFDRILKAKAVNDDGEEILDSLDLSNMTIGDAMKETLDKLMADGYLKDDPNGGVVITTSSDKEEAAVQLAAELEQEIQGYLDTREGITAKVDAEAVSPERVKEAREHGVTPGKLNLVEKLRESTAGAISEEEFKEWLDKPVKEINKAIKENRKAEKDKEEPKDKPEKQDQVQPKGKDGTEKIDRDNEKMDRGTVQKTDWQKTDEVKEEKIKDENAPDKEKTQKDDSNQGNGGSSGKSKDKGSDKDKKHND